MHAAEHMTSRCPHCDRPMGGLRYGVRFGEQATRIIDAVKAAGIDGIKYDALFARVYADRASKRTALKGHIFRINQMLGETCDVQISGRGGRYHISTKRAKRLFQ